MGDKVFGFNKGLKELAKPKRMIGAVKKGFKGFKFKRPVHKILSIKKKIILTGILLIVGFIIGILALFWTQLNMMNTVANAGMLLLMEEEEAQLEEEEQDNWWDDIEFDPVYVADDENNLFAPTNDNGTIPNGVYPSNPELKLKAQILELTKEVAAYTKVSAENLFAIFYAEHGATVHYSGSIPDIYTNLVCAYEYSSYFDGGDVNLGKIDTTSNIKYGPMGILATNLTSEFKTGYNAIATGKQGTFTANVMSNTNGDFARPHPLYLPDAMYYVAQKLATSSSATIEGGTTDYDNFDFVNWDLRNTPSGATAEMLDAAIAERIKNHAGGKVSAVSGCGELFLEAEKETGVSALFWVAFAAHESAMGTSGLASGKLNLYSWGATDYNTVENAQRYENLYEAIVTGAKQIAKAYINNTDHKQYTVQRMRYYPGTGTGWHQYASDPEWHTKMAIHMKAVYKFIAANYTALPLNGTVISSGDSYLNSYSSSVIEEGKKLYAQWNQEIYNTLVNEGKLGGNGNNSNGKSGTKLTVEQQNAIRTNALSKVGCPYVWGAKGPDSFDCSGLVIWTYKASNIPLSYSGKSDYISANMRNSCVEIGWDELEIGDLIFKHSGSNESYMTVHHVLIYVGNGECVDASSTKTGVLKRNVSYYQTSKDSHLYSVGRPKAYYQETTTENVESGFGGIEGAQWPMKLSSVTSITSQFGWRGYSNNIHSAIDFVAPQGTPLYPILDGMKITKNGKEAGYGNVVTMSIEYQGRTLYVKYNHMDSLSSFPVGSIVNKDDIVGYVGGTNYSSSTGETWNGYGMHLDWEFFIGGGGTSSQSDKAYKAHPFEPLGYNPYQTREWRMNWLKSVGLNKFECNTECYSSTSWDNNFPQGYWVSSCPNHWTTNMAKLQAKEDACTVRKPTLYQ